MNAVTLETKTDRLQKLADSCELTPEELVRQSLELFEWTVLEVRKGGRVGSVSPDVTDVQFLSLAPISALQKQSD